jgi:hypothetical protein
MGACDGVTGKGIEVGNGKLTLAEENVPFKNQIFLVWFGNNT